MTNSEIHPGNQAHSIARMLATIYLLVALGIFIAAPFLGIIRAPLDSIGGVAIYVTGVGYLLAGIITRFIRHQEDGATYAIFAASTGLTLAISESSSTAAAILWGFSISLAAASLAHLVLVYPGETAQLKRWPVLRLAVYILGSILLVLFLVTGAKWILYIYGVLALATFLVRIFRHSLHSRSAAEKEEVRLILWGTGLSVVLTFILFLAGSQIAGFSFLPLVIFPITLTYVLTRSRLLNPTYILTQGLAYTILSVVISIGYALIVTGLSLIFPDQIASSPLLMGIAIFVLALLVNPLRLWLLRIVDNLFFKGERIFQERLEAFTQEASISVDLAHIVQSLRRAVEQAVEPARIYIFLFDSITSHYSAVPERDGSRTTDLTFSANGSLSSMLKKLEAPLILTDYTRLSPTLHSEQSRLLLLGAQVLVKIGGQQRLNGWLCLSARKSGAIYSRPELEFLEKLCQRASADIERIQSIASLEKRVQEMNILTRVAQGVNITPSFDDVLELIFAQTCQVIPTRDFRVTLYDQKTDIFTDVFLVQEDNRLSTLENKPLAPGSGLEQEVIRSQRIIKTNEHEAECQRRKMASNRSDIFAWVGVPLNAGAETIGCISIGSRDADVVYTPDQINLLQAIADQAAGAIIKARLLRESEQRSLQMTSLNEVARQLTSTLELDPLLTNILNSAVEILDCEAGSLMLLDEQSDELVFKVANGPVAGDLVNKRIPAHSGLAGKSVTSRQPIIVNNVHNSNEWLAKTDQETGFQTHAMLVVPLELKDRVTGVIEVINKRNGLPFTQEDQALLTAFSAQAAVAIENARLYTLTDQALAERVNELSVMQRIDRDLNASLDVNRAMRITLEWALRQTGAEAGLIGVLGDEGIQIVTSEGYHDELALYESNPLPAELEVIQKAIQSSLSHQISLKGGQRAQAILPGAHTQVCTPIRRETTVMGILLLESTRPEPISTEVLAFLNRLSDHAAIAISNAQLYQEVTLANTAKSDFVSFVSHELKNPMTSIKGYTELLAAGAVGPVNESQANFLTTIRSNVERMAMLVSDLTDVSRIEAGKLLLEFKPANLDEVVEEVGRSNHRQIEEKEQQLSIDLADKLPPVWVDRTRLIQILTNLVSNASKYTQKGGEIGVIARPAPNQWDPEGAQQVVHIRVWDNGYGISPEDQKKLFQKFFRSEDPKVRETSGTGLGLNITKSLIEMQGGRIWYESKVGSGTTFHFTVPVAEE